MENTVITSFRSFSDHSPAVETRHPVFVQLLQIAFCLGPSVHTFFLVSHSKYPGNLFSDNLCYVV
jgi:hypothetical protein